MWGWFIVIDSYIKIILKVISNYGILCDVYVIYLLVFGNISDLIERRFLEKWDGNLFKFIWKKFIWVNFI